MAVELGVLKASPSRDSHLRANTLEVGRAESFEKTSGPMLFDGGHRSTRSKQGMVARNGYSCSTSK